MICPVGLPPQLVISCSAATLRSMTSCIAAKKFLISSSAAATPQFVMSCIAATNAFIFVPKKPEDAGILQVGGAPPCAPAGGW
jgi:hypothetical protein